jgi:hypothetical protein
MRPYSGDVDLHVDGRLMRGLRVGGRAQKITLGTAGNGDRLGQASKSDGGRREDHAVMAVSRCSVAATAVGNLALITVRGLKIFVDTFLRLVSRFAHDHLLLQN